MNIIDKTISIFNPKAGAERAKFRAIEKTINSGIRGYEAATKGCLLDESRRFKTKTSPCIATFRITKL